MDLSWLLDKAVGTRIAGTAFVLWGATAYLRCLDARNRRRLVAVAALLSAWMLLVVVRWKVPEGLLRAVLWYAYYIPLTALPLLCLLCAARASGLDRRPWARAAARALWCAAAAIVVLVLTNDAHEQVFRFLGSPRSDSGPYAYAWGHRLVVAWSVGCYLAFFAMLLAASRRRLRPLAIPPVAACLAGIVFSLAYGAQRPWAAHVNFSLVYGVLVAGTLELCLDLGFIASSRSFMPVFDELPIDLKVLGRDGAVFRATRAARPLADDVRARVASLERDPGGLPARGGGPAVLTLPSHPGEAFHVWRLAGGAALLAQDTRGLDAVTRALAARQEELRRTNRMLERRRQTESLLGELRAAQGLMDDVERAISSSMGEVVGLLDGLAAAPGAEDDGGQARQRSLKKARMVLAYCKRKSSLALFESADPELDRDRVGLIANELACDLRAVGIDCAAAARLARAVPARDMSVLYDCIYGVAFVAFACTGPVLMYYLGEGEGGAVELRARLQSDDPDDLARRAEAAALVELLTERGVAYSLDGGPGALGLVARVCGDGGGGAPRGDGGAR